MKVVFLDIDGVLVNRRSLQERSGLRAVGDPNCIFALNHLLSTTDAKIVLSSSWRFCGLEEMRLILSHWGVIGEMIGLTPDLTKTPRETSGLYEAVPRGREIQAWLNQNECESFVILDDDADMEHLKHRLVKTEFEIGLTPKHAEYAIEMLASQNGKGEGV